MALLTLENANLSDIAFKYAINTDGDTEPTTYETETLTDEGNNKEFTTTITLNGEDNNYYIWTIASVKGKEIKSRFGPYSITSTTEPTLAVDPNGGKWNNSSKETIIKKGNSATRNIPDPIPPTEIVIITFDANEGVATKTSIPAQYLFVNWTLEDEGSLEGKTYTFPIS